MTVIPFPVRHGAVAARRAHNPEVVGSTPTAATNSGRSSVVELCAWDAEVGGLSPSALTNYAAVLYPPVGFIIFAVAFWSFAGASLAIILK